MWLQDDQSIAPYGYGNTFVTNTFHHYCLNFQKNNYFLGAKSQIDIYAQSEQCLPGLALKSLVSIALAVLKINLLISLCFSFTLTFLLSFK